MPPEFSLDNVLEFQAQLDKDSAWRKKELALAYSLAENANNPDEEKYLCRAWVLVMYAHCDSFLKNGVKEYLKYSRINPSPKYRSNVAWLASQDRKKIIESVDYVSFRKYLSLENENTSFIWDNLTDEKFDFQSFDYKLLRFVCDWIIQVDFDHEVMTSFCKNLKLKRNAIAHGEPAYVDKIIDCLHWHKETLQFIDEFKSRLIECVTSVHQVL